MNRETQSTVIGDMYYTGYYVSAGDVLDDIEQAIDRSENADSYQNEKPGGFGGNHFKITVTVERI